VSKTAARHSTQHGTFVIERDLPHPPARVFAAWAEPKAKAAWFSGPSGKWTPLEREMDFRVGGRERAGTRLKLTEQGAFLDGYDDAGSRERGTGSLMDALEKSLEKPQEK
jgi:activator of Hsp90 ATPase-like protein